MVVEVLVALDRARSPDSIEAVHLPVLRHLEGIQLSGQPAIDAVLEEFLRVSAQLPWIQTAGYLDVMSRHYLDNFGYVQLIGPGSIVEHSSVRVGIGVWGPHLHYPAHHHEAEELYHVLAGEPVFTSGTGDPRTTRPGDAIHHAPWQSHTQDFGAAPSVLLYCWTGAVVGDAELVDST